ncbi:MAG: UDP-3-O-[3-hydroxymyristoyl] N-acetylglucosamine deacetylase [Phycisphaera sp.]|nr:UDP-3-O-[3-hydroxymyristoyl] N-acetylglucosamine deacetylase [Phycisphaera sp.]
MDHQTTIDKSISVDGPGLFMGQPAHVTFRSAPANHGVVFLRRDMDNARIPALVQHVVKRSRRTTLRNGDATVDTCEHALSAIAGLGIDNLLIEIDGPELPMLDGSAIQYAQALQSAGIRQTEELRRKLVVTKPIVVRQDETMIAAVPSPEPGMQVVYDLDYQDHAAIGRQLKVFDLNTEDYLKQIAPARTFVLDVEAKALRDAGIGTHLTERDVLVFAKDGPMAGNTLRYPDEPVRHKIVDVIGDLSLLGAPIQGRIIAYRSGHALNHKLVHELLRLFRKQRHHELSNARPPLDIRKLFRILPHRYPMLLVDRVIELDGDRRAVGVKNVTANEPFFTGHYPGTPIMPGVLIVEAMAQLSGVLIGQKLENTGKLAILLSLDRVKLRRAVTPGDQLFLEAEAVRVRSRIAHMRCRAYVGEELAAEAEVKFMLVDDEQEN